LFAVGIGDAERNLLQFPAVRVAFVDQGIAVQIANDFGLGRDSRNREDDPAVNQKLGILKKVFPLDDKLVGIDAILALIDGKDFRLVIDQEALGQGLTAIWIDDLQFVNATLQGLGRQ